MNENLIKFLKSMGLTEDSDLWKAFTDKAPDDFDYDTSFNSHQEDQEAVWRTRLKPVIDSEFDDKFKINKLKLAKKVAKAAGLELSATEAAEKGFDAIVALVPDHIKGLVDEATTATDETLKAKLDDWQTKAGDWETKFTNLQSTTESAIQAAKDKANGEVYELKLGTMFQQRFKLLKDKYGKDAASIQLFEEKAERVIRNKYMVHPDGKLNDKNGEGKAVSFNGLSTYTHVDEAIAAQAEEYKMLKKHNKGTGDPPAGGHAGVIVTDKMSPEQLERFERMKAAYAKRNKG